MFLKVSVIILLVVTAILCIILFTQTRAASAVMRDSPVHGRGMFATRNIKSGEVIETVPLLLFNRSDVMKGSILLDYDLAVKDKHAIMLGYASIYNHSDQSNASWEFDSIPNLFINATRDIYAGEEIFVDYGTAYWDNRNDKK